MLRMLIGGILAGLVFFIWGWASWELLPWHDPTLHGFTNEAEVATTLGGNAPASGAYFFPYVNMHKVKDAEKEAWAAKHRKGPVGIVFYTAEGSEPMSPRKMGGGFVLALASGLLLAYLLSHAALKSFMGRLLFAFAVGVFVAIVGHLQFWNWMGYPTDYTLINAADQVVSCLLAGLVLALIVRKPPVAGVPPAQTTQTVADAPAAAKA